MRRRYPALCLAFLLVWWGIFAVSPRYRTVWLYENILVFAGVPLLVWLHLRWRISNVSCTLITIFLALHVVGAHYTYQEVPLFDRVKEWSGGTRNQYDRCVHFAFGFLLAYPVRELFVRTTGQRGFWAWFTPLAAMMAGSVSYEFMEWAMMLIADPNAGQSFLGAQGDEWDGHKDMMLASLGAFLSMTIAAALKAPRTKAS